MPVDYERVQKKKESADQCSDHYTDPQSGHCENESKRLSFFLFRSDVLYTELFACSSAEEVLRS